MSPKVSSFDKITDTRRASADVMSPQADLVFYTTADGKTLVKSGSPKKLLERLIDPNLFDISYTQTFLLTHKQFIESRELLQTLNAAFREKSLNLKDSIGPDLLRYSSFFC